MDCDVSLQSHPPSRFLSFSSLPCLMSRQMTSSFPHVHRIPALWMTCVFLRLLQGLIFVNFCFISSVWFLGSEKISYFLFWVGDMLEASFSCLILFCLFLTKSSFGFGWLLGKVMNRKGKKKKFKSLCSCLFIFIN